MQLNQLLCCSWNVCCSNMVNKTILNMLSKKPHKKERQYFYIYKTEWSIMNLLDIEYFRTHQDSLTQYRKEYLRLWFNQCFYMLSCRYSNMKVYISNKSYCSNITILFPLSNPDNYTDSFYYGENEKNIKLNDIDKMKQDNFLQEYKINPCYKNVNNEWIRIRYDCFDEFNSDWMKRCDCSMVVKFIDCKINDDITIRIYDSNFMDSGIINIIPENTNDDLFLLEASFYINCGQLHLIEFKDGEVINID